MEPNAFLKSMYVRYISSVVSLASSRVSMIVCICLDVLRCGRKPSWLEYSSRCCSPWLVKNVVSVQVYSFYIVLASAIGL